MPERLIWQTAALAAGFLIDFFVGDPYQIPHPVVAIGKLIDFFDHRLRRGNSNPADLGRGALTVVLLGMAVDPETIRRHTNGMEFSMAALFLVIFTDQIKGLLQHAR